MSVSVLLPVRDGAAWLSQCIRSLEGQTLRDFEVVAVDDGSTDGTASVLGDWSQRNPRVTMLRQEPLGLVAALERARAAASGTWLARMDADDVALPERLERQLALVEGTPGLVGCGCRIEYFPRARLRDGALRYERWLNGLLEPDEIERDFFVECPLAHPTFFVRAEAVDEVGGYRDRGWPEDYDLLLRLREAGGRFAKVGAMLLRWRDRSDRLSRTAAPYAPEAFRRCKVHFLLRDHLADRDAVVWGAGPTGKAFAVALGEAGGTLRAFVDLDPRKIGQEIHGVPVVPPGAVSDHRDAYVLAAVGQEGAREEIRATLRGAGWAEPDDFRAVA
ncbi:MAG: glycosyltransferase [Gemmatimonadota bacterium]|jgi:glycosyltransferase involved in cell wall biosynthesis